MSSSLLRRALCGIATVWLTFGCGSQDAETEYRFDQITYLLNLDVERVDLGERKSVDLRRDGLPESLLDSVNLGTEQRRALRLRPGVAARFGDAVQPGSELVFDIGFAPDANPGVLGDCEVAILGPDGTEEVIWSRHLTRDEPGEERWQEVRLALAPHVGGDVVLRTRGDEAAEKGLWKNFPAWGNPRVIVREQILPPVETTHRNTVIFLVDTLRADHLTVHEYAKDVSPHIEDLADESLVFEQAHATASWTKPSIASLFTSRYASQHGAEDYHDRMKDSALTLAEVFGDAGITTGAVGFAPFVFLPKFNLDQGFRDNFEVMNMSRASTSRADEIVTQAIDWITRHRDEQFLLYIQVVDPHEPYEPLEEARARFVSPRYSGPLDGTLEGEGAHQGKRRDDLSDADLNHVRGLYDAEIAFTDEQVGRLITHLRGLGLWGETTFVFTADHGEEFLEHGGWSHGGTLFQEQLHVPLLVKPPASAGLRAQRVEPPVSLLDVAPTLCRFARVSADGLPFLGQDLTRLVNDSGLWEHRMILAELRKLDHVAYSIRRGDVKYIRVLEPNPREEVFRLDVDPDEQRNVIEKTDERVLESFRKTVESVIGARRETGLFIEFLSDGQPAKVKAELFCRDPDPDFTVSGCESRLDGDFFSQRLVEKGTVSRVSLELAMEGDDRRDAIKFRTVPAEAMHLMIEVDGKPLPADHILLGAQEVTVGELPLTFDGNREELHVEDPPAWKERPGVWCRIWNVPTQAVDLDDQARDALKAIGYFGDDG